jgi:FixJ family two-component response regulator
VRIPIIFMTGHADVPMTVKAMKAGAFDFLAKPFREQEMLDAVAGAIELDRARLAADRQAIEALTRFETLSQRERDVMELVTAGLMNKQAAARIGLAESTVKMHRSQVMKRMGAKSLPDLVRMAELLRSVPAPPG